VAAAGERPGAVPSPLAAAAAAGASALGAAAGARVAIISCYAAMEESLSAAGSPRLAADTPEELLNRAVGTGAIRTPAAARLTVLFREARFSPHRLGDEERRRWIESAVPGRLRTRGCCGESRELPWEDCKGDTL
jgi:Domain of unknown function (DUF4129)